MNAKKVLMSIITAVTIFTVTLPSSLYAWEGRNGRENRRDEGPFRDNFEENKERVARGLENAVNKLESLRRVIQSNEAIPQRVKDQIISKINKRIEFLNAKRREAEEAKTSAEFGDMLRDIKNSASNEYKWRFSHGWAMRIRERLRKVYRLAEKCYEKLREKVENLKQEGKDVSNLESKLEEIKGYIDDARNKLEQASALVASFDEGKPREWLQDREKCRNYIKDAIKSLKNARDLMKEVRKEIKAQQ